MQAKYLNHYLSDREIASFARQSFARADVKYTEEQDAALIRYLARGVPSEKWEELIDSQMPMTYAQDTAVRHALAVYLRSIPEHWVPFGHPQISLAMQAPVPIARQLFKHKIGFVESEESRRYIKSTPTYFVPQEFRSAAKSVKQGSAGTHGDSSYWKRRYQGLCEKAIKLYTDMIEEGVCPEQARFVLPQGCEVNWVWTGSLYAFANFYNQRSDEHAQKESQELAEQVNQIIAPLFPVAWAALTQGKY